MSGLQLLSAMQKQGKPLADMASDMCLFPQKLWNILMSERTNVLANSEVQKLIADAEVKLAGSGRINVRMSGTEPKLRVMVEAEDEDLMLGVGEPLTQAIREIVC